MFAPIPSKITHEALANTLPFYCCWLTDKDDPAKPCTASVVAGSAIFSVRGAQLTNSDVIWIN